MQPQNLLTTIEVRQAMDSDLSTVVEILDEQLAHHVRASGGDVEILTEDFLRETLEDSKMLVAAVEGEPIGYLQYQIEPPRLVVNGTAIRATYQRRGLGTFLFAQVLEAAEARGCDTVEISVQPTNVEVWETYRRYGFREAPQDSEWNRRLVHQLPAVRRAVDDKLQTLRLPADFG